MPFTRKLPAAAAATVGVLLLAACSPFGGLTDSGNLSLLTLDGGEDNLALEEIVAAFEEQSDGVKIDITYVPEDTYATKLQTSLLADAPDIAAPYGAETMFSFDPLDEVVFEANGLNISDYNAVLESFCGLEGKLYCIGTTVGNMGLFYNKALFDAAGIAYPDDIGGDELRRVRDPSRPSSPSPATRTAMCGAVVRTASRRTSIRRTIWMTPVAPSTC